MLNKHLKLILETTYRLDGIDDNAELMGLLTTETNWIKIISATFRTENKTKVGDRFPAYLNNLLIP